MLSRPNSVHIAQRFAQSLDAEDYAAAAALLSKDCEYECRGKRFRGPAAIVESYRENGDSAGREFGAIDYESHVQAAGDGAAVIRFVDHLTQGNRRFTFECEQVIEVGADGRITRIRHVDLPGQREALERFRREIAASGEGE